MSVSDSKNLLKQEDRKMTKENEDDWWESDDESSCESYYSDSGSSIAEWETEIGAHGEVFYIESYPDDNKKQQQQQIEPVESPVQELNRRRSTRAGKLMRLIRRRESKRYSTRIKKTNKNIDNTTNNITNKEVKFHDYQAGEIRHVLLSIDPDKCKKLGRRATLCEAYLGIIPGTFSDKIRVMVSGFIPNNDIIKNKNIKIGDWLKSIDEHEITTDNLELLLSNIIKPCCVKLELQRVAGVEVTVEESSLLNIPKKSARVKRLIDKKDSNKLAEILLNYSFSVLYLNTNDLEENGAEYQGVVYAYPKKNNKPHSLLCTSRGAFITLNHLSPDTFGSTPSSTTIKYNNEIINIFYLSANNDNKELLLISIPDKYYSLDESTKLINNIIRYLNYIYKNINLAFAEINHDYLNHFFTLLFSCIINITIDNDDDPTIKKNIFEFESIIEAAHFINLPKDAKIQIDAALNEMEAMDYRDWNEDPMDCQRLYTILGSCIYHKSYLLSSHLPCDDLLDINSFLRLNGLLNLVENESIKSMVIWRKIYPTLINKLTADNKILTSNGKYFILIVGFDNDLLAVLVESGGCTTLPDDNEGPDVFYVEEAQETLKHIQKIGISNLADKWISSNTRPETIDVNDKNSTSIKSTITDNLLGFIKSNDNNQTTTVKINNSTPKVPEVTSILKKKSPEQSPIMSGSSIYSLQTSEDSISQGTSAVSEISDDTIGPILGRRATREMYQTSSKNSDDSDDDDDGGDDTSDVDNYRNDSQTCTLNLSDIRENLLNQAEYIAPIKLTAGLKNSLFHFVHLDSLEGLLLSSRIINNSNKNSDIIAIFNKTAHCIHKLFNNSVRFKNMINTEVDKTLINKNLVAIKEHGILFELGDLTFWVVGRLYAAPNITEFYVCYQDTTPQNLVEMAFRLNEISNY
ncbi:hypothetical protein HCN44_005809 [Aphidius gifuensis]|uniref:Inturned planar cell polarity effector homolog n=1 Tax=Aphidius gifuensis TaxID=684658 RepID=A0A834XT84_APHGI|nr:protein inturned [Aphidius gifuensis]KAF7993028.1 hypothetical protein HCN44_005809 [Aphidius gifuensis]